MKTRILILACFGLVLTIVVPFYALQTPRYRIGTSGRTLWEPGTGKVLWLTTGPSLWDLEAGKAVQTFQFGVKGASWVQLSPDGTLAAAGVARNPDIGTLPAPSVLFDVETGREIRRLESGATAAFDPDGDRILTIDSSGVRFAVTKTGQELFKLFDVGRVIFSRGRKMAGIVRFGKARVWDTDTGKEVCTVDTGIFLASVDISPDGALLVTTFNDGTARTWETAMCQPVQRFAGHTNYTSSVRFSADGQKIISGSGDGTVRLWETATGRELRRFEKFGGEANFVLSPDTKYVITEWQYPSNAKRCSSLWNVDTGREIRQFCPAVDFIDFSPDSTMLLVRNTGKPELWNAATGERIREYPMADVTR
jgi:WD40 repeat protein